MISWGIRYACLVWFHPREFPSSTLLYIGYQHLAYLFYIRKLFSLILTLAYLPLEPIEAHEHLPPYIKYTGSIYTYIMSRHPEIA